MSTPPPHTLRLHRALAEVPRQEWNALLDEQARPFLEWEFLAALEESGSAGPSAGWHPRHLTLWRGERLVAAMPAWQREDSQGEFVYDMPWAAAAERLGERYYPKLVVAVPFTPATGRRVLVAAGEERSAAEAALYRAALEYAREERLSGVHVLFPTAAELATLEGLGFAVRLGVQYQWRNPGYRSLEDFLARFHSHRRHQIRREMRALGEQGIALRTLRGEELAGVEPEELFRLYASTVDRYPWSRRLLTRDFFARLLATFRHRCELVEARSQGRRVAAALNLAGPRALYGRYWGALEHHPFLHFNVCLYHPVAEAIALGLERFEPGAGGEHKLARGFEPQVTYSAHILFHPRLDMAVRTFLAQEQAALRAGLPHWQAETGFKQGAPPPQQHSVY